MGQSIQRFFYQGAVSLHSSPLQPGPTISATASFVKGPPLSGSPSGFPSESPASSNLPPPAPCLLFFTPHVSLLSLQAAPHLGHIPLSAQHGDDPCAMDGRVKIEGICAVFKSPASVDSDMLLLTCGKSRFWPLAHLPHLLGQRLFAQILRHGPSLNVPGSPDTPLAGQLFSAGCCTEARIPG